ncbi:MAG: replication-associated recombination protein A [Bacteroidales bacterium]|nr:replication-associated recombination protein A [Bacteroidales bacterium]MBR4491234.1 replication-associated recombination protein A [Bacteroidales bacterium]MBR4511803.1 replication-associated recombination protein A [Bacteroidales bacterium]
MDALHIPLAEAMRPNTLEDYAGQKHLLGEGAMLRQAIQNGKIPSMIFWGPPGVGKTTLALLISNRLQWPFFKLSAINSGVKEVRDVIEKARQVPTSCILFIDEIHRFSKNQQDSLLGAVEAGIVTLIGATTENPSFEVISPLLSRCQVYILKPLEEDDLQGILNRAVETMRQRTGRTIRVEESGALFHISGGDARKLLNAFELCVNTLADRSDGEIVLDNKTVQTIIQQNLQIYDKGGEMHYDIISAFIKSIRGSDPNAAVYWLARMIAGGEDPKFIARRMLILASEDIGNANPNAMLLASDCFQAIHVIGMPEARIILSQTAIYLACSPKSNASYLAIDKALAEVEKSRDLPVPLHLRNAPTRLMKDLSYGKDYKYAHDFKGNFVEQDFLPPELRGTRFYEPGDNARENELRLRLRQWWKEKYRY